MGKKLALETRLIEVKWEGPFTYDEVKGHNKPTDQGIYVAFGPHNVYGDRVPLYIGKAQDQTFAVRIPNHLDEDWYCDEEFYLGRLGGSDIPADNNWLKDIDYVESKMIQYCLPSWNSQKLRNTMTPEDGEAIIINNGLRIKGFPRILADWLYNESSLSKGAWEVYSKR